MHASDPLIVALLVPGGLLLATVHVWLAIKHRPAAALVAA
jgi:hypothetical protein